MIKIMVTNGTVFFIFFGIILFFIVYKITPFLNYQSSKKIKSRTGIRLGNPSVLDNLLQSSHKYEIRDCFITNTQCKSDQECREVCTEGLFWYCDDNICKLREGLTNDILCENGDKKTIYDFDSKQYKQICVCKSPLYYGPSCSNIIAHCDTVKNNNCLCNSANVHFLWYIEGGSYDLCVPKTHYKLFSNQDNFKPKT